MPPIGTKASRSLVSLCSAAALVGGGMATMSQPAAAKVDGKSSAAVATQWSYQAVAGHRRYSKAEALKQAQRFDFIAATKYAYRGVVPAMKAANPRLRLLAYVNGAYAQRSEGSKYPSSWYLRTKSGAKVRSRAYGNYLMNVGNPGWVQDVAARCRSVMRHSGYNGCFLDMMGTASTMSSYTTGTPVNPRTHRPYSDQAWLSLTSALSRRVQAMVGPRTPLFVNGLGSGPRYFQRGAPSSQLLKGIDGALAESWLHGGEQALSWYPSEREWKQNVDMLRDVAAHGKVAMVTVKTWGRGTQAQKDAWHKYSLASYLLAANGSAQYSFLRDKNADPTAPDPKLLGLRIGVPSAAYVKAGSVYRRQYTSGMVFVNPTSRTQRVAVPAGYGARTLTMRPHSGEILQRR